MKFNKKEISLCEQIAKKYRRNLKIGMYVWRKFCKSIQLIYRLDKEDKEIYTVILKEKKLNHLYWNNLKGGWLTPLWTISDCLEFLRKRDWLLDLKNSPTPKYGKYYCACFMPREHPKRKHGIYKYGNTTLETLLEVILENIQRK